MKLAKIGKKYIGDNRKCYITFEAGPTHFGYESAKRLISYASDAKADAIKFQFFNPDQLYANKKLQISYKYLTKNFILKKKKANLYDLFKKRYLTKIEIKKLKKFADKKKIDFFLTIGDKSGLELISELNCKSVKIASADINYIPFIRKVAKKNMNIQIDTGNSTLKEIYNAIKTIREQKNQNIIIHYCPSGYPAKNSGLNFKMINFLKKKFKYPIGYSDHFYGDIKSNLAIFSGANLIEKTISENIFSKSIEHSMSAEIKDAKKYVQDLRNTEKVLNFSNDKIKFLSKKEVEKRFTIRRSAYLNQDLKKGDILDLSKISFKRPGKGISPNAIFKYLKKKLKNNLKKNSLLLPKYF